MKPLVLASICSLYGSMSVYFGHRWILYRRRPSLLCAAMPLGWVLYAALQFRGGVGNDWVSLGALVVGLWGVVVIVTHEMSQPRPFQ